MNWFLGFIMVFGALISGCKQDCSEAAKMGDFELSQGNYANAIRHYERALKIDAKCGIVAQKLSDAKARSITAP